MQAHELSVGLSFNISRYSRNAMIHPEKHQTSASEEGAWQESLRKQWSHSTWWDLLTATKILKIQFPLIQSHRKYFFIVSMLGSVVDAGSILR